MKLRACLILGIGLPLAAAAALPPPAEVPDTIRWSSSVGEVVFPHLRHSEEFGAECVSCHHQTAAANLTVPHPSYFDDFWVDCKVCHTGGTPSTVKGNCAACHPDRPSGLNQEIPTVKVAIHRNCWSCHDRGTGAEASANCGFCHQRSTPPQSANKLQEPSQPKAPAAPASNLPTSK